MRCNREAPARHAVAGIPSGEARDAAARSSARMQAMMRPPPQTDNEDLKHPAPFRLPLCYKQSKQ